MKNALIAFAIVLFTACSSDDTPVDYSAENEEEIQAYITTNNLTAQQSNSGLYYIIDEQGSGIKPELTDRVKVIYKGYLTNGDVFDENEEGASFPFLGNLIQGFAEGLTYFNEGGKGTLIIPAHLAYGSSGTTNIEPGAVILFDIELVYVNYEVENEIEIQTYLNDNNLIAERSDSGLYYIINEQGTGEQPTLTNEVTITYKGYLTNGETFDESTSNITFNLSNLIQGFAEGITYFNEGGSGTLLIPAHLAYGNSGVSTIPPGAVILFDISLISIN